MKKSVLLVAVAVLSLSAAVVYADPAKDDMAERVKLSKDLHDVRHIRDRINATISGVAEAIPPEDREDFSKYVQLHVNYDDLEQKSIQYAAEVYTAPELKAMIAYFGSADGQSAEAKGGDYASKITKDISKEIDAAILAAKYDGVPDKSLPPLSSPEAGRQSRGKATPDMLDAPRK